MSMKIFGERVALVQIDEALDGELVLPPSSARNSYDLGKIVEVGDCVTEGKKKSAFVAKGDVVLFQHPSMLRASTSYHIDGKKTAIIPQSDLIARLKSNIVNKDNFEIIGNWMLLRIFLDKKESVIVTPDSVQTPIEDFRFKIEQKGAGVDSEWEIGDEVYVEKKRCNPILLGKSEFVYIDKTFVYGILK